MASPSSPFRPLSQAPAAATASRSRGAGRSSLSPPTQLLPSPASVARLVATKRSLRLIGNITRDLGAGAALDQMPSRQVLDAETETKILISKTQEELLENLLFKEEEGNDHNILKLLFSLSCGITSWLSSAQSAQSSAGVKVDMVYEIGELFELGIQLSYLLVLLGLLGAGTFFVIRQVLVRRELDLSAKELQEQVRSGDATATEYFELGAVMLRRKFYSAAIKYLQQAIEKWDTDDQDVSQAYNALGVCYIRDNKLEKGIAQFQKAVKIQPGYVTAWNNLGDAYEKKKDLRAALKAFEEALLFDPNNTVARPRRDALRDRVQVYKGVPIKSEER